MQRRARLEVRYSRWAATLLGITSRLPVIHSEIMASLRGEECRVDMERFTYPKVSAVLPLLRGAPLPGKNYPTSSNTLEPGLLLQKLFPSAYLAFVLAANDADERGTRQGFPSARYARPLTEPSPVC